MGMNVLNQIRRATEGVMDDMKWPFQEKKIRRALESVSDSAKYLKTETEIELLNLRKKLTKTETDEAAAAVVKEIIRAKMKLIEAEKMAEVALEEQEYLSGEGVLGATQE